MTLVSKALGQEKQPYLDTSRWQWELQPETVFGESSWVVPDRRGLAAGEMTFQSPGGLLCACDVFVLPCYLER